MTRQPTASRLDHLDASRAFALVLGVVFHASLSFMPVFIGWAVQDISTSPLVPMFVTVSHSFRMELFFLLAGFFGHMAFHRKGGGAFIRSRALRIVIPFVVGWFLVRPLLVSGWIMGAASLRGDYDFLAGIIAGFKTLETLPAGIFTGSHLWFLYYLALITSLVLAVRWPLTRFASWRARLFDATDALVAWLSNSPLALPALAVPTACAMWFMRIWGMDTPDQSLLPHVPVLFVYGGFFALGWVFDRQPGAIFGFARLTPPRWMLAIVGIAGTSLLARFQSDPGHPHFVVAHAAYVLTYALMMWSLVSITLGVFRKLCQRPRPFIRYIADSSYWMYLVHLPIVVWLQVAVAEVDVHWSLKVAFISVATIGVSLLTYDLFVRSTFIGVVLNGRRRPRVLRLPSRAAVLQSLKSVET